MGVCKEETLAITTTTTTSRKPSVTNNLVIAGVGSHFELLNVPAPEGSLTKSPPDFFWVVPKHHRKSSRVSLAEKKNRLETSKISS